MRFVGGLRRRRRGSGGGGAIGTETDGSIVCPSGANGVVGHKPTMGLVSRTGVVPLSAEQDTAGPMTRHVVDSAITLSVLQGRDPADRATGAIPGGPAADDYAVRRTPYALHASGGRSPLSGRPGPGW